LIHSAKVLLLDNHVSFGNIVFGLASAQHSTGFVGCATIVLLQITIFDLDLQLGDVAYDDYSFLTSFPLNCKTLK
ncbi:hypothetical protein ACTQ2R_13455, partial [Hallella faecis]|uniref:hypothetical protein n=1 Tax=Hallella faecis TaxID=2841596 RepID=UPI003F909AEA